eukprot:GHVU01165141.1.p2 GENE.GHVU01165141.1~~GHVU01165141.1.p2  ORF type:complete len:137 (-),score=1.86 GHVU01165141.1:573-983(-)
MRPTVSIVHPPPHLPSGGYATNCLKLGSQSFRTWSEASVIAIHPNAEVYLKMVQYSVIGPPDSVFSHSISSFHGLFVEEAFGFGTGNLLPSFPSTRYTKSFVCSRQITMSNYKRGGDGCDKAMDINQFYRVATRTT